MTKKPKFMAGQKVYWQDGIVGDDAWGIVECLWNDSRLGWVMYVKIRGNALSHSYPLHIEEDMPSLTPYHQRVYAGPRTL